MAGIEIEPRVQRLENNHTMLSTELSQMNRTLGKIEVAIEKQNEIHTDIRMLTQKFDAHIVSEDEEMGRIYERIRQIESDKVWLQRLVYGAIASAVFAQVFVSKIGF